MQKCFKAFGDIVGAYIVKDKEFLASLEGLIL